MAKAASKTKGKSTDFEFGHNTAALDRQGIPTPRGPTPTYASLGFDVPTHEGRECREFVICEICKKVIGYHGEIVAALEDQHREIETLKSLIRSGGMFDEVAIAYPIPPKMARQPWESFQRGRPFFNEWESHEDEESTMDLKGQRSSNEKKGKFERLEFISPDDLPSKGASKWKIVDSRESKSKKRGILGFIDLQKGKIKRTMSLRKGFTLDALMDELGTKTEKWVGKTISLIRGGSDGQYVNVA